MIPQDCSLCRLGTITVTCPPKANGETCERCQGTGRRLHRTQVIQGQGKVPAKVMLLGEGPGYQEDLEGLPFRPHAPAGRILRKALTELQMDDVYLHNIVLCRPLDNKLKNFPDAIVACKTWLDQEIEKVQPRVIVALGALAGQRWFPGARAGEMAERARAVDGRVIIGSYHPSFVARGSDPRAWPSLMRALRWAQELGEE